MGILNVTPDSFSDGGLYTSALEAVSAGRRMLDEGADILDVGGESTRPGAQPVTVDEELRRVIPVIETLARHRAWISVDTMKPAVAQAALQAGAKIVNDVTALAEPEMVRICAENQATVCLMHMQGSPQTMQEQPTYKDVVQDVLAFLQTRADEVMAQGVEKIWIDPGIGFGKTSAHNFALLRALPVFVQTEYPVLIGVSRKGFIGRALGGLPPSERLEGTLALQVAAQLAGVSIIRTHDVRAARRAITLIGALGTQGNE